MENGDFSAAAQLADAMGRDDRVEGVLATRIEGLLGLPMEFEPHGDARRAKVVAKDVEARFWSLFPEDQVADLLGWGLRLGFGLGELVYTRESSEWKPTLRTWWPGYVSWRWDTRSFWVQTQEGPVEVTPGDGKWILYAPYGLERGWMRGAVRRLAIPWLIKQWARRDWARYSEVHGLPGRKAKYPARGVKDEDRDDFIDEVANLGSEPTIGLPQGDDGQPGFDFELVEAVANTWQGFEKLLAHCDTSIGITILGGNLSTEVKGGSHAAAAQQDEVRIDRKRFDAETLSTCLHEQALKPFARWNYGDPELAPYPEWETDPPSDEGEEAGTLTKVGEALAKLTAAVAGSDVEIDVKAILDDFGVPTRRAKAKEEAGTVPPAAPAPADPEAQAHAPKARVVAADEVLPPDDGQAYADQVAAASIEAARQALAPEIEKVLAAIEAAKSFDELRAQLPGLLDAMDPTGLAELTRDATLLALLAGRKATQDED